MCVDGLSGIKESISLAFLETEYQRCIVHQVRNWCEIYGELSIMYADRIPKQSKKTRQEAFFQGLV